MTSYTISISPLSQRMQQFVIIWKGSHWYIAETKMIGDVLDKKKNKMTTRILGFRVTLVYIYTLVMLFRLVNRRPPAT